MKLVIEIDKDKNDRLDYLDVITLKEIIRNGKPLPKGHGRLKDVDWIDDNCPDYRTEDGAWCYKWEDIDNAPTIIEAESEE